MAKDQAKQQPSTEATTEKVETPAPAKKAETKRKILTPQERVAKLEAELKAAREKAEAKAKAESDQLTERRAKIVERRDLLNTQIEEIDKQLEALKPSEG